MNIEKLLGKNLPGTNRIAGSSAVGMDDHT